MIDKAALTDFINGRLADTDMFLVDLRVSGDNVITVEVDSDTRVDIDECVALSRAIEEAFDREQEDYELEVGSSGLTSPLKLPRQYAKYIGQEVETIGPDGKKYKGLLRAADADTFTLAVERKVKPDGAKRPVIEKTDMVFPYAEVKNTKYILQF